ncbi:HNH endonuclease family protein [Streptomyces sp. NPDC090025]|uniref:HNH endonuclease family protein n=1 Tax=Streptomyces sp. NPDC090025 TaxID=3365922 RepID=UPI003838959A
MGRQQGTGIAGLAAVAVLVTAVLTGCSGGVDGPGGAGGSGGSGGGSARPDAKAPSRTAAPRTTAPGGDSGGGTGGGGAPAGVEGKLPGLPSAALARTRLAALTIAPQRSMTGYSRDKFPHWAEQGDSCNTRETVLERDGTGVRRDSQCRAVSGNWLSVYDGKTFTKASGLDIDHMVPLANAWRSGADRWTQEKRKAFANDLVHPQLLAVSAVTNRSKGDQGPDEWQPPSRGYWCVYARAWTSVKSTYGLTATSAEAATLGRMLDTCGS